MGISKLHDPKNTAFLLGKQEMEICTEKTPFIVAVDNLTTICSSFLLPACNLSAIKYEYSERNTNQ